QAVQHLLAIEFLAPAVFFHHHVGNFVDALIGGETPAAFQALATAANRLGLFAFARVDDLIIQMAAKRTLHGAYRPGLSTCGSVTSHCNRRRRGEDWPETSR